MIFRRRQPQHDQNIKKALAAKDKVWENRTWKSILWDLRSYLLVAAIMLFVMRIVFGIAVVHGDSMNPTLQDGDVVIFFRLAGYYQKEDVVLAQSEALDKQIVKRVCAVQDEEISCEKNGMLKVDGKLLAEPYSYEETYAKEGMEFPVMLQEKQYFLLGDHRENSQDSRNFGPVNEEEIKGRVIAVLRFHID